VTISALDARGLYTTELDASEQGAHTTMALQTGDESQRHSDSMSLNEDVMAEFADGTGGTFFTTATISKVDSKSWRKRPSTSICSSFHLKT